jgi:type IV secretory pathway TraG/TraD family ATPase VirD4
MQFNAQKKVKWFYYHSMVGAIVSSRWKSTQLKIDKIIYTQPSLKMVKTCQKSQTNFE